MVKITKDELNYLLSQGYTFPEDLYHTHTKHKTYYVTEGKAYNALKKYRRSVYDKI